MARTTQITFGQVAQFADQMKAAGTRPTARALRERIGSGSMGTIHRLLQQYNGTTTSDKLEETPELPASIASALMDFVSIEVATACEPINLKLTEATEASDSLAVENERLEEVIIHLQSERDNSEHQRAAQDGKAQELDRQLGEIRTDLIQSRRTIENLNRDLAGASNRAEALEKLAAEVEPLKEKVTRAQLEKLEAEKQAAVMAARLEGMTQRAEEASDRAESAEKQTTLLREEIKQANSLYQACASRLEAAVREIESIRKAKAASRPAAPRKATPKTPDENASV